MNAILFVVLDQFADFEYGPIAAVINRSNSYRVKTVSMNKQAIQSIGGLTVMPDFDVEEAMNIECSGIVLIGGDSWRNTNLDGLASLLNQAIEKNVVIAAICDACTFLARIGLLNTIEHTANQLSDLISISSDYVGQYYFMNQQVVSTSNVITANGTASMEFAKAILSELDVMPQEEIDNWYDFFTLGYYSMQSFKVNASWIEALFQATVKQDEDKMAHFFSEEAIIIWPNTNETFTKQHYILINCNYPGKWVGHVVEWSQTKSGYVIVGYVKDNRGTISHHVTSFIEMNGNKINKMVEYWSQDGTIPSWRSKLVNKNISI